MNIAWWIGIALGATVVCASALYLRWVVRVFRGTPMELICPQKGSQATLRVMQEKDEVIDILSCDALPTPGEVTCRRSCLDAAGLR